MSLSSPPSLQERIHGGLYGLLLGDACGVPVEFSTRAERDRDPVKDMRGYGTYSQPPGHWSDDGALMLAHIGAFLESDGWEPERHLSEFAAWFEKARYTAGGGVFDIGETTSRAILRHLSGHPWVVCGCRGTYDNGNGSLMRILPVALWMRQAEPEVRFRILSEASSLTHRHRRSQLACIVFGEIAIALLEGVEITEACTQALTITQGLHAECEWDPLRQLNLPNLGRVPRRDIRTSGYVLDTLQAAVWCLNQEQDYQKAVLLAVNLGGDTDTTAAVCGGLAGLRCGSPGLPSDWLQALPRQEMLKDLFTAFTRECFKNSRDITP